MDETFTDLSSLRVLPSSPDLRNGDCLLLRKRQWTPAIFNT